MNAGIFRTSGRTGRMTLAAASDRLLGSPLRNLVFGVLYMIVVMLLAVIAYVAAGWQFGDALYMVIITVYTVGYGETMPVDTPLLRAITISVIVLGCTGMIFLTGALVQFITLNQLNQVLGFRRMNTEIDRLRDHVIVCGFGRIGLMLAQELRAGAIPIVVLEQADAAVAMARELGYLCIQSDATDEEALQAAGVVYARTLATVLSNDAANVFITLSARSLNPKLEIIARGELPSTETKLLQAGANKVVLPAHIGAERIAELILYQDTAAFIRGSDKMKDFEKVLVSLGLDMDVVAAAPDSQVIGKTIEIVEQEANGAFFIVQINRRGGEAVTRPAPATVIEAGDGLVVVGRGTQARALGELFGGRSRRSFRRSAR
jgi:Trk K+ transport system NAD-binding subunit